MYFWSETREWNIAKKDTAVNYMKLLTNLTLLLTSKLKDWHGRRLGA